MTGWDGFVFSFFNARVAADYAPKIVEGLLLTIWLALLVVLSGLALGLVLAVVRAAGIRVLNWAIIFTVDVFRALPPLVLIVLIYFGLPAAGIGFSGFGVFSEVGGSSGFGVFSDFAAAAVGRAARASSRARKRPVCEPGIRAMASGVPSPTISPPPLPPSGPKSMT